MALDSMKEIFDRMEAEHKPFWEIVLETDMDERQVTRQQSMAKMLTTWQYMVDAADTYTGRRRSVSGLVGGDGLKMRQYSIRGRAMSGGYVSEVIAEALSMAESNACMRRIVAAPTAGAGGGGTAVLGPMCKYEELSQHRILEALYVASGIGAVIAYKACIAGASGGCQAEIGTASAMAAGALVALRDGTGQQIGHNTENTICQTHRPVHTEYEQYTSYQNTGDNDWAMLRHLRQYQHINRAAQQRNRQRAKESQYREEPKDSLANHGAYHVQSSKDAGGNQITHRQPFFHLL